MCTLLVDIQTDPQHTTAETMWVATVEWASERVSDTTFSADTDSSVKYSQASHTYLLSVDSRTLQSSSLTLTCPPNSVRSFLSLLSDTSKKLQSLQPFSWFTFVTKIFKIVFKVGYQLCLGRQPVGDAGESVVPRLNIRGSTVLKFATILKN